MKLIKIKYASKKIFEKVFNFVTYPLHIVAVKLDEKSRENYKKRKNTATEKDFKKLAKKIMKRIYESQYKSHKKGYENTRYVVLESMYKSSDWNWDMAEKITDFMVSKELSEFPFVYNMKHNEEFSKFLENEFKNSPFFKVEFESTKDDKRIMIININK